MNIIEQFKKGYKTSEFWTTIITLGVLVANEIFGIDLDGESIAGLVAINFSWVTGRSYLKVKRMNAAVQSFDYSLVFSESVDKAVRTKAPAVAG